MTAKINNLLYGLIIAAIIAGGFYYFLREEPLEDTKKESVVSRMAFSGSSLTESQDGKKLWDLTARIMEVDTKTQWVYMTDLKGIIYRVDGTEMTVTSNNAIVDPQTRNVELTGDITMKSSDGSSFRADQARYIGKDRKIFATGAIRAIRDDYLMTANELETDDQLDIITIKGNARIVKGGLAK